MNHSFGPKGKNIIIKWDKKENLNENIFTEQNGFENKDKLGFHFPMV